MTERVKVDLGTRAYNIVLGHGFETVLECAGTRETALIISDSHVDPLYGRACAHALEARGFVCSRVAVPAGEASKSLMQAGVLFESALDARLDRHGLVVALGGGVVGDLAGFVAATYLRGVRLLQVPTSLLAMVDSSVGGKTAVNLPRGKNLVGVFYQPVQVAVNMETLQTLPDREYRSGLAEIVKYGVIADRAFFEELERRAGALRARDPDMLQAVIARCCGIKAAVVGADERENGLRAILNYGHTLGHAIESVAGYGALLHGEAVALGMVYAGWVSERVCGFPVVEARRVTTLLQALGLPVALRPLGVDLAWERLRMAMSADKKALRAVPTFVLAEAIGTVQPGQEVQDSLLTEAFAALAS